MDETDGRCYDESIPAALVAWYFIRKKNMKMMAGVHHEQNICGRG